MKRSSEEGYAGLLAILIATAIIGLLYYWHVGPIGGTATSTPTQVGQSTIEQDFKALESAKVLQDASAKRAAEINAQMEY